MNMRELMLSRTTAIWFLLVAATFLSFVLGHESKGTDIGVVGEAIIIVAFAKIHFVIFDFMEIRRAPSWMRWVGNAWLLLMAITLVALLTTVPTPP